MPELPEVETIARRIQQSPFIIGQTIQDLQAHTSQASPLDAKSIIGCQIKSVSRRGKQILFTLDNEHTLVVHLMLTGQLILRPAEKPLRRITRYSLHFTNGRRLDLDDPKGIAKVNLCANLEQYFEKLGVEPLSAGFNCDYLYEIFQQSKRNVKAALVDQKIVAGIGNTYADEILFTAQVHPKSKTCQLTHIRVKAIVDAAKKILQDSIDHGGADSDWAYLKGSYPLKVYNQQGEPCVRCGTPINQTTLNGRATFFCPVCQSLPIGEDNT